jgi:hypothetical protein
MNLPVDINRSVLRRAMSLWLTITVESFNLSIRAPD